MSEQDSKPSVPAGLTEELTRLLQVDQENLSLKSQIEFLHQEREGLASRLHASCIHPDYEYASTHGDHPPGAHLLQTGWELNQATPTMPSHTPTYHWRRLKACRNQDPAFVRNLPPVVMAPMTLDEVLNAVREVTNNGYMPSSKRGGYNSKPDYVTDLNAQHHTNYYAYDTGAFPIHERDWEFPVPVEFTEEKLPEHTIFAQLVVGDVVIWINLKTDVVYLRACNAAGKVGPWTPWGNSSNAYPIDRLIFAEQISLL